MIFTRNGLSNNLRSKNQALKQCSHNMVRCWPILHPKAMSKLTSCNCGNLTTTRHNGTAGVLYLATGNQIFSHHWRLWCLNEFTIAVVNHDLASWSTRWLYGNCTTSVWACIQSPVRRHAHPSQGHHLITSSTSQSPVRQHARYNGLASSGCQTVIQDEAQLAPAAPYSTWLPVL